jgi:glycosyltransferase involved in cell wall biosynthesis
MTGRGGAPAPIAFFLPSLNGGGAERVVLNLMQGITERGLPVDLVVAAATGPLLAQLPVAVRLVDLKAKRVIRSLVPLTGYLRRERPRVLISSMNYANLIALWAGRLSGSRTPVIVTVHTTLSYSRPQQARLSPGLWARLFRNFYPWASSVVAVSRGAADDFARVSGLPGDMIEVVYNPVITPDLLAGARKPPPHPWFAPGEPPVFLGVGRLTRQKDFSTLIRAFAQVRQERTSRLLILGDGEDRATLTALANELDVAADVALPGFQENAAGFMAASAVFVLSSGWEGLPTVLIEALAAGTRVVSTDCPSGPREILQDGRLGALVPVGDAAALAHAMIEALDRPRCPPPAEALRPFTRDAAVDHYLSLVDRAQGRREAPGMSR